MLNAHAFERRLAEEIDRIRRRGGFLSLLLLAAVNPPATGLVDPTRVRELAASVEGRVRLHDVLALLESAVAVLMPGATAEEAVTAGRRLLRIGTQDDQEGEATSSGGVASVLGDVEGDGPALIAAAEEALREAPPGQIACSRSLGGRPGVLVVDDDFPFAQALADAISERGWEAHSCTSVDDALQRAAEPCYSALFVDLVLPGGTGVDIVRKAIASHPKRPVVLMTGFDVDPAAIVEVLELGPVLFVRKPISGADLDVAMEMFRELLPGQPTGSR